VTLFSAAAREQTALFVLEITPAAKKKKQPHVQGLHLLGVKARGAETTETPASC
jgi:hypothetical protein